MKPYPIDLVSVVIPVYNEEASLPELLRRTEAACLELGRAFEIVLVDDGSRDRSAELLQAAAERDGSAVVAVILNRNWPARGDPRRLRTVPWRPGDHPRCRPAEPAGGNPAPGGARRAGLRRGRQHPRRAPGLSLAALAFAPGEPGGAALHRGRHARLRLHAARLPAQHRRSDAGLPRTQYLHPDPGQRLRPAYLRDPRRPRRARPRRIEIQRDAPAQPDVRPGHLHDHHAAAPAQPGRRRHGPGRLPLRPVPPRAAPGLRRRLGRQRPVRAVRRAVHVQRRAVARHGPARRVPRAHVQRRARAPSSSSAWSAPRPPRFPRPCSGPVSPLHPASLPRHDLESRRLRLPRHRLHRYRSPAQCRLRDRRRLHPCRRPTGKHLLRLGRAPLRRARHSATRARGREPSAVAGAHPPTAPGLSVLLLLPPPAWRRTARLRRTRAYNLHGSLLPRYRGRARRTGCWSTAKRRPG